jgi:glycine/D-amino acid oxidase-like deaminating enzyme
MASSPDVLIVGAGLAGACAALVLSESASVTVVEADAPAAGASGAAAGLVNPLMGRRANPVWRPREALAAVSHLLAHAEATDVFQSDGLLRPTVEAKQVEWFQEAVAECPDLAIWLSEDEVRGRFPDVQTVDGAMLIPEGGAVDVPAMVHALLEAATANGATVETGTRVRGWDERSGAAVVSLAAEHGPERRSADRVLLCLGQGYPGHAELEALDLRGIKGQTVRVERPDGIDGPRLPVSGRGYIVPEADGTLVLGSSYDHDFDDLSPDPEQTAYIQEKTARMLPGVDAMDPLDVAVGVRVKQAQTNLPVVGPLPDRERVWTFTALGSKGLLTAPLLSLDLPDYLHDPSSIPHEVRVPRA